MNHVPEICYSICGALLLVSLVLLLPMVRAVKNAPIRNDWS